MAADERADVDEALRRFAEERLNASGYADCTHRFARFRCGACRGEVLRPTIERHPGDRLGDFMGILWTACDACGVEERALSSTAQAPDPAEPLSSEEVRCTCGGRGFYLGSCERWENWGFFDEGTVVAMCHGCGALRALVDTD